MQVLESMKNSNVPPTPAKGEGETRIKVPYENKSVSDVTHSFRDRKAGDQSRMSGLSVMASRLLWCQNPIPASFSKATVNQMRAEMERHNELLYESWDQIRAEAKDLLTMLIHFDTKIGLDDSRVLCDAVNIINKVAAS